MVKDVWVRRRTLERKKVLWFSVRPRLELARVWGPFFPTGQRHRFPQTPPYKPGGSASRVRERPGPGGRLDLEPALS